MPKPDPQSDKPRNESLRTLLAQLVHASLLSAFNHVPIGIIDRIITMCALFALVVPLLLWVSWSKTGFLILIAAAAAAVGIIYILIWLYPEDPY